MKCERRVPRIGHAVIDAQTTDGGPNIHTLRCNLIGVPIGEGRPQKLTIRMIFQAYASSGV